MLGTINTITSSDRRLKTNLMPIQNALKKVSKLNGVYFHWIQDEMHGMTFDQNRHVGIIAQELERVLPEVVHKNGEYLAVDYEAIIPLLIEAIHELDEMVVDGDDEYDATALELKSMIESLSEDMEKLGQRVQGLESQRHD